MNGVKTKHFSFRSRQAAGDSAAPVQAGGLCENTTPGAPLRGSSGGSGRSPMAGERRGLRRSGSRGDAQPGPRSAPGAALPAICPGQRSVPPPERPRLPPPARPRPPARSARARAGERGRCRSPAREPPPRRQRSSRPPSSFSFSAAEPSGAERSPAAALPASVCGERGGGRQLEPGEGDRQPGGKSRPLCAVSPRPALPLPPARAGNPRRSPLLSRLLPITEGGPGTAAQRAGGSRGPGLPWPLAPAAPDAAVTPSRGHDSGTGAPRPGEEARDGLRGTARPAPDRRGADGAVGARPEGGHCRWALGEGRARGWRRDAGLRESRSLPLPIPREVQQPRSKRRLQHNSVYQTKKMPLGRMGGSENSSWEREKGLEEIRKEQRARAAGPRDGPVGAPRQRRPWVPAPRPGGGQGVRAVPCPAPRGCEKEPCPLRRRPGKGAALAAHRTCRSRQPGEINACVVLR
ncbi:uncharacterized protein LOC141729242 [Zonotrichia albicollis]|uniref:uncharacterized protein LOC141729242 n=1 Tax=Zonotrichia albicollis TaxID=44394 RepID=UPI003D80E8E5